MQPTLTLHLSRKNTPHLFSGSVLAGMIIPLVIEQLLQTIVGIADTLMVSYAGQAVVSGVSLDTMFYTIFLYLFSAIAAGGAVVVSQYIGRHEKEQADLAAGQLAAISLIFSLFSMVLILLGGNGILNTLYGSASSDVLAACRTYLWIVTLSFPANALYNACAALYRSMSKTRTTMMVSAAMNLVNVAGNAYGIFVLHAGAAGAAWPTTIAWYFAAVTMFILCLKKGQVTLHLNNIFTWQTEMAGRILKIGIPNGIENGLFQLSKVVLGSLIAGFGTSQIAANGIGQTIWSFAALVSIAMQPVYITVIGQCMGAKNIPEARYYMVKLTKITLIMSFTWNMAVLAFMPLILPLYSITEETRHLIWVIVIIHNMFASFAHPFFGPLSAGLRAAGDVRFTLYSSIFCTVILRVVLSVVLGLWMHLGVIGITLAMVSDWCVKGLLDLWRFFSMKWTRFQVI